MSDDEVALAARAVAGNLELGRSEADIVEELRESDWPEEYAVEFVHRVAQAVEINRQSVGRKLLARAYARHMVYGPLWVIAGIGITAISYHIAVATGCGAVLVTGGFVLYGIIDFFRGLFGWIRYSL